MWNIKAFFFLISFLIRRLILTTNKHSFNYLRGFNQNMWTINCFVNHKFSNETMHDIYKTVCIWHRLLWYQRPGQKIGTWIGEMRHTRSKHFIQISDSVYQVVRWCCTVSSHWPSVIARLSVRAWFMTSGKHKEPPCSEQHKMS